MESFTFWLLERLYEYSDRLTWFDGKISSLEGPYFSLLCEVGTMKLDVLCADGSSANVTWRTHCLDRLSRINKGITALEQDYTFAKEEYDMISEELRRLSGEDDDSRHSWGEVPVENVPQRRAREDEDVVDEPEEEETRPKKRSAPKIAPGFERFPIMTNKPYRRRQREPESRSL